MAKRLGSLHWLKWLAIGAFIALVVLVALPDDLSPNTDTLEECQDDDDPLFQQDSLVDCAGDDLGSGWFWAIFAIFTLLLLGISVVIWLSSLRSSAGRGQWVWFAFILLGFPPFVATLYFILDKTGWGKWKDCGECW